MGKSYVENSLKRFLKRKVKITMGVVVTFLITGAVAFAEDTREQEHKDKIVGIETANKNLAGLGNGVISAGENNSYVTIEKTADKTIIKNKKDSDKVIAEIDNSLISTKTAETVSGILQNMDGSNNSGVNKGIVSASSSNIDTNNGIISSSEARTQNANANTKELINNGIICTAKNNAQNAQEAKVKLLENNGIIVMNMYGQIVNNKTVNEVKITNNGVISGNSTGQILYDAQENNTIVNNGLININEIGQSLNKGMNSKIFNYGTINGNKTGQLIGTGATNGVSYNYGFINVEESGQKAGGETNKVYNVGLISAGKNAIETLNNAKGYNYGVVKVADAGKAFSGDVTNKGIVIADNGELDAKYNTGILLDSEYNAKGEDTKVFKSGETVTDFAGNNTFGEDIIKGYVKNASVNIDNTQGKLSLIHISEPTRPY